MSSDTGYSKRSLAEKLGLKAGVKMFVLNPPPGYLAGLAPLQAGLEFYSGLTGPLDFIQFFTVDRVELADNFPSLKAALSRQGQLWVSWPKGSAKIARNLNENQVRETGLANGLVDVKVISIDETWSGLKFVYRLKDR